MEAPVVQKWLKAQWLQKRVFIITGLKIARPSGTEENRVTLRSEESGAASGEAEGSGSLSGAPIGGGLKGSKFTSKHSGLSFIPTKPFI